MAKSYLVTSSGQRIHPNDPNYDEFLKGGAKPESAPVQSTQPTPQSTPTPTPSSTPQATPPPQAQAQQATVFHPVTGQRKVVNAGDPNAFAGGFVLETPTDTFAIRQENERKRTTPTTVTNTPQPNQTIPAGYEKISGATYSTREAQQAAYSDIQQVGNIGQPGSYLIGKKKTATPTTPQAQQDLKQAISQIDAMANEDQQNELSFIEQEAGKDVDLSESTKLVKKLIESLTIDKPTSTPSLQEQFNTKRAELGVGELETSLNDVDAEIAKLDADYSSTQTEEEGRQVSALQIRRRQGKIDEQYQRARRDLLVERNSIANQLNMKYGVLNTMVTLAGKDYDNAQQEYQTKFTQAIQLTNLLQGIETREKSEQEQKKDNARANLQIMYNLFKEGNVDFENLDPSTKLDVKQMEIQAGLPVGFTKFISENVEEQVTTFLPAFTDATGQRVQPVGVKNADGTFAIQNIKLGQAERTGGGGSGSGGSLSGDKYRVALGNYKQGNPGKTQQDFDALPYEDKVLWSVGGPETPKEEKDKTKDVNFYVSRIGSKDPEYVENGKVRFNAIPQDLRALVYEKIVELQNQKKQETERTKAEDQQKSWWQRDWIGQLPFVQ